MTRKSPDTIDVPVDGVAQARVDVVSAESALEEALLVLERLPRAQKTSVSDALSVALSRLRAAREKLEGLLPPGSVGS